MTLNALNSLVHAAEGIAGLIVVKFGDAADGLPTGGGMAILARNVKWSVGVARHRQFRRTRRALREGLERQYQQ